MKKIVLYIMLGMMISCRSADSTFEEYIVPGGLLYPAKAMDVIAHSGRKRIEITWKNGTDPSVVKACIFWNNYTDTLEIAIDPSMDVITQEIRSLDEDSYSFMIRTYDAKGNVSVPVEVIGRAYGEMYERSLGNRIIKSANYDEEDGGALIEWGAADKSVVKVNLSYTDTKGAQQTREINNRDTYTELPDLKRSEPVRYYTVHKPDSMAIDQFYSAIVEKRILIFTNVTDVMKNTEMPFKTTGGDVTGFAGYYLAEDWRTNPAGAANGNVYAYLGNSLWLWTYPGAGPPISNGKLYQTVELEAGEYEFRVFLFRISSPGFTVYIATSLGNNLPDIDDVEDEALAFASIREEAAGETNTVYSIDLILSEKSVVSLGFIGNLMNDQQIGFRKVELWQKK